jgi:hypothetical protein
MKHLVRSKNGGEKMTVVEALEFALRYIDNVEVKGHENAFNLHKAYDAVYAAKVALQSKKEDTQEAKKE